MGDLKAKTDVANAWEECRIRHGAPSGQKMNELAAWLETHGYEL